MKLIGIVGSNAEVSYNRLLIEFIAKQYKDLFEMEILEIKDVPLFNQDNDQTATPVIQNFNCKIEAADGVIIATPEHNHTITAALKSLLEWLSFKIHPLDNKPVMVVGASYYQQGSSRAQLHLRQILDAPGVNAYVFPGNEFLLGNVKEAFDQNGNIMDQGTVGFLRTCLEKFVRFVEIVGVMDEKEPASLPNEDLFATGKIDTTIEGIEMKAADWVEQAADKVKAAKDNDYVLLNRGVLTVNQLNVFLNSMPMELTFADANNQFIYYNYMLEDKDMLAKRRPEQVGNALAYCHPERARHGVEYVIQQLRSGNKDLVQMKAPNPDPNKFVVHSYQAMRNEAGHYMGVNEYIQDIMPIVNYYLQKTGQKLVGNPDATTGASETDTTAQPDATSGASETNTPIQPQVDVSTNASETTSTSGVRQTSYDTGQAQAQPIDNVSGASEH